MSPRKPESRGKPRKTAIAPSHERSQRARRRALQALYQWQITGQGADEILAQFHAAQDMRQVDTGLFESLVRGVVNESSDLDEKLQGFMDRPVDHVDLMEKVVLRLGAWQLLHCRDIPYRVLLDESIDLAHRFGAEQGHAYINGVLDQAARAWRAEEVGPG